jgi:hypothetical protein
MRRFRPACVIAVAALGACVSTGRQVELAGVAPPRQSVRSSAPTTVDLLPIESQVAAYPGHRLGGGGAAMALRAAVISALPPVLGARHYRLASVIDQRQVMTAEELAATRAELLRYIQAQRASPQRLVPLALPHQLGRTTGSRATLFVAGYGFAGDDSTHIEDVMEALAVTEAAAATVGAVGEVATSDDGLDGVASTAASYADTMADVNATLEEVQAMRQLRAPHSHFHLVVTLVDNASGRVIWYADREVAGRDPTDPKVIRRAIERSLGHLPRPG